MFSESDLLPLSALQHLAFCERQWGLIHLEQLWEENHLTAQGRVMHERADEPARESRGDVQIVRALKLRSLRLGLAGQADVVEFHHTAEDENACPLPHSEGRWRPFPVEYKRGRPKKYRADEIQLCAQALCLEEMLSVRIDSGALFYGQTKRRTNVLMDAGLRALTESLATRMHQLFAARTTPIAEYSENKCTNCSLIEVCKPRTLPKGRNVTEYLNHAVAELAAPHETKRPEEP